MKPITCILVAAALTSVACGGESPQAKDPSRETSPTNGVLPAGRSQPGDAMSNDSMRGGSVSSPGAPTSPADGGCYRPEPTDTKDAKACVASCRGYEEGVPPGTFCPAPKAFCLQRCNAKFASP